MFKLGKISDTHVGYRQYGLEIRWKDFNEAFGAGLYTLAKQGCRHIVLAGDLLHQSRPTARTMASIRRLHDWCLKLGLHVMVIRGNHDFTQPHWLEAMSGVESRPKGTVLPGIHLYEDEVVDLGEITVYLKGFEPVHRFLEHTWPAASVCVIHQSVAEFCKFKHAGALVLDQLPTDNYSVIVVGDTHVPAVIEHKKCTILSPGSTEMNKDDEPTEKYVWVGQYAGHILQDLKQFPIETRHVLKVETFETPEDADTLTEMIRQALQLHKRLTVSVTYDRRVMTHLQRVREVALSKDVIFRARPKPTTKLRGLGNVTPTPGVQLRSLVEIAKAEVENEHVLSLVTRIVNEPEETAGQVDEWLLEQGIGDGPPSDPGAGVA